MNADKLGKITELFCIKLHKLMKRDNYSRATLASVLGVSVNSVNNWLKGKNLPATEIMLDISELFGVSVDSLLSINQDIVSVTQTVKFSNKVLDKLQKHITGKSVKVSLFDDISDTTKFGSKLNSILGYQNMSCERLAKILDLPTKTVRAWIDETDVPSLTQLVQLCDVLHVSMDRIAYSRSSVTCIQNTGLSVKDCDMLRLVADALRSAHVQPSISEV